MTPKHRMFVFKYRDMLGCREIGKRDSELFIKNEKNLTNKYWNELCPQDTAI